MPNTTNLLLPYPSLSSAPNVPQDIQNLAAALEAKMPGVVLCTSGTRPPSPLAGTTIYETDTKRVYIFDSVQGWLLWPGTPLQVEDYTAVTGFTNTAYAVGSPIVDTTWVAPPSGKVSIAVGGYLTNSSASIETVLTYEIRNNNAAGSVVIAATSVNGIATSRGQQSMIRNLGAFTPGNTYYTRLMHAVNSASTGNAYMRRLIVTPIQH